MKTEKKANRCHSDMENDRVKTYRRIASTMFNEGVINMGRILVLFAFTSQMGQQYPIIFIGNDVSDWSTSFKTSYLIGQSFCMK
jgi:hypothetical protein